jgi:FKBP-type peptidyl-prolyl cis-trans isomerase 2
MCPVALTDTVSISYTATLENGEVVEKVPATRPITLSIGSGRVLKAVEACLLGMNPGETRTINVQPEDAYGPYFENLVHDIKRSVFEGKIDPKPGMILSLKINRDGQDQQVPATVLEVTSDTVTVDYNHPLAGKVLTYTVILHAIGK